MKHIFLSFTFILFVGLSFGQDTDSQAFSDSYKHEYNKEYDKAIMALDKVYQADSYEMNLRLGWLHYSNGTYLKSQNFYKNAILLQPKSIEAMLGYAYPTSALENWDDVVKMYEVILTIDPNNYTVNSRMASIFYYKGEFEKANNFGKIVAEQYPFDYSNNLMMGKINISLGNIIEAKKFLNKALLYNPSSEEVNGLLEGL